MASGATRFGQAVIGPPGAGKTTYCQGMAAFLRARGRACAVVNLDPANDALPYTPDVDVAELVKLADVMEEHGLGPNGGLVYCMEYLEKNLDWLLRKLEGLQGVRYLLFDFPGQVELYTHGETVQRILQRLEKWGCRLAAVHLIDAHHCGDAGKFISAVLISLTTMIRLELPHVNVLSKIDLIESGGRLAFGLGFYTDLFDLRDLLPYLEARPADPDAPDGDDDREEEEEHEEGGEEAMEMDNGSDARKSSEAEEGGAARGAGGAGRSMFSRRYRRLNAALCDLIEDFSLVNFQTLNIQDGEAVQRVLAVVDKANGYLLGAEERAAAARAQGRAGEAALLETLGAMAFRAQPDVDRVKDVQDRYMGGGGAAV